MIRVHVAPSSTTNGELKAYGAPPLSVVPSVQFRTQPTSDGNEALEPLEQVIVELMLGDGDEGGAGGECGAGDGGGGVGGGGLGGDEGGEGGSKGGGIGGKIGSSTTTDRLAMLRSSLTATAETTVSGDKPPSESAFASSTPPRVVTESTALIPEKVLSPTLTLAASSCGVSVIPIEELVSKRENVALLLPSTSVRRLRSYCSDVRTQLGYRLLHASARASNAAVVGGMTVILKSCSTTMSVVASLPVRLGFGGILLGVYRLG
jgi:hypothetical protein